MLKQVHLKAKSIFFHLQLIYLQLKHFFKVRALEGEAYSIKNLIHPLTSISEL